MPELTVRRSRPQPDPMVCMYCGAPATEAKELHVVNREPSEAGGGTDLTPGPSGEDPVSAVIGLLMLPFVLWDLLVALAQAAGAVAGLFTRRPDAPKPAPPPPERTTRVAITACGRHRRFGDRFLWAGGAMLAQLAGLWGWAIAILRRDMGTDHTDLAAGLTLTAVLATVLLPCALGLWYALAGPVLVERVTENEVVLDRVRQAYFDATGVRPHEVT
jgi:hypothetical protein